MPGPDLCPKCKRMHYLTDKCPADLRQKATDWFNHGDHKTASAYAMEAVKVEQELDSPKPNRSGNRHRSGYFTEYMRDYRKGIRRRKTND